MRRRDVHLFQTTEALGLQSLLLCWESVEKDFSTPRPRPVFPPKEMPLYPPAAQGPPSSQPPSFIHHTRVPLLDDSTYLNIPGLSPLPVLPAATSLAGPRCFAPCVLQCTLSGLLAPTSPPTTAPGKITLNADLIQALPL